MTELALLLDSTRLAEAETRLGTLINRLGVTETPFGYYSADEFTGPRCGRCNRLLHHHLWQFVDRGLAEQGGVMECETAA